MFIVFLVPHIILSKQSVIFVSCYYLSYLFTQVTGRTRRLLQKQWTFHSGGFLLTATSSPSTTPLTWALCEQSTRLLLCNLFQVIQAKSPPCIPLLPLLFPPSLVRLPNSLLEDWDLTTTLLLQPFPLLLPSASHLHLLCIPLDPAHHLSFPFMSCISFFPSPLLSISWILLSSRFHHPAPFYYSCHPARCPPLNYYPC